MIVSEIGVIGTYNAELTVRKRIYFLKGKNDLGGKTENKGPRTTENHFWK